MILLILQLRIDERLIHGQISTQWSKVLDVDAIVVANDDVIKDQTTLKVLMMGAPAGRKVVIRGVGDAITMLKDPRAQNMRILLIVDNPKDAIDLVKSDLGITEVNVANFIKKKGENKIKLAAYCSATPEDLKLLKELLTLGVDVYSQMIPQNSKEDIASEIQKATVTN